VARADGYVRAAVMEFVRAALSAVGRMHGPAGPLARSWPTGSMVLWAVILLGAYLLFYL
jgi:multicomponent Na+:H+ antiporter subunit D